MSAEGIDETVELHLIDTRQLVEEAKKIREGEALAKKADKVKEDLTSGISPLGGPGPARAALPKGFFDGGPQSRLAAITGAKTGNAFVEQQKQQKALEKEITAIKKHQADVERKLIGNLNLTASAITNPKGLITNEITSKLGKFGVIGALIAGAIGTVSDEIIKQFERGGVFSTRLKVPRQAQTLNDVEEENAYRSGTKYITSDLRVLQRAPSSSNTANLKHEHIRYTIEDAGH